MVLTLEQQAARDARITWRGSQLVEWISGHFNGRDEPVRMAEIGVMRGRLSEFLLKNCPHLHLFMIDRWAAVPADHRYAKSERTAMVRTEKNNELDLILSKRRTAYSPDSASRRILIVAESIDAAKLFAPGSLDVIFLDADHTYEGVTEDLTAWYPAVRPGGLICGHDIDNPGSARDWGVRRAVETFRAEQDIRAPLQLGAEYTWRWEVQR